jgi:hypothetical protein
MSNKFALKGPKTKSIQAVLRTVNSFTGKHVPTGPVADRKDPKVSRTVFSSNAAVDSANSLEGRKQTGR